MNLAAESCYRALQARDRRFDGRFFVAVRSTGIYCRPICPARTPKFENCRFFRHAAAAEEAGFRACLRCRPEISPQLAAWRGTSNTVSRALALVGEGFLDSSEASVEDLANRVGLGERQLRRLFQEHVGASPVSIAQTRRIHFAKQLLHETSLSMTEVAMAAGFGSVRRFNETFRQLYKRPPTELRRKQRVKSAAVLALHAPYQPPYDWQAMLRFLRGRVIDGVEQVGNDAYQRTIQFDGESGWVEITNNPARGGLTVRIAFPKVGKLPEIMRRVREVFDLGADIERIGTHLAKDSALAPLLASRPGLRAPGGWDAFELAVRAVLGQQITVDAARALAAKLVRVCDRGCALAEKSELRYVFPDPPSLAAADLSSIGMPQSRKNTLKALAQAVVATPDLLSPAASAEEAVARLRAVKGIGEWTAQYIALRALRESDAFPASDIGILRGAARLEGVDVTPRQMLARAEGWRPWRGYAAQHLWTLGEGVQANG